MLTLTSFRAMSACVLLLFCLGLATAAFEVCVFAQCPRPEGYENMLLVSPPTFPAPEGSQATFRCEVGYRPTGGSGTIACSQGRWTTLKMRCEIINCGSAGEVPHGHVDYSKGTDFGSEVKAVCDSGYTLVGVENRMYCGVQGWMGTLGECEGNVSTAVCDAPAPIANGSYSPESEKYKVNEFIMYSCHGDHTLNGSRTSVCTDNGVFSPAPPTCVLVECESPDVSNSQVVAGARPQYKYKSFVKLRCYSGYKMEGQDQAICDINSKWTPDLPLCTPIE